LGGKKKWASTIIRGGIPVINKKRRRSNTGNLSPRNLTISPRGEDSNHKEEERDENPKKKISRSSRRGMRGYQGVRVKKENTTWVRLKMKSNFQITETTREGKKNGENPRR